ncbi:MAG: M23 family metallopeptidase [Bacteroidota bacterium]
MSLCWLFFVPLTFFAQNPVSDYQLPLAPPALLSATFGELRTNHFHAGIDFKTNQETGKEVFAVSDGYISRIRVSPWGYGKTLYINHPDGYTSVYAHLSSFSNKIEKYSTEKQYEKQKFQIDITIPENQLPVRKGEIIALSGNTGSSAGPHLHFEIRETDSEFPVDPLRFFKSITDDIPPVITALYLYDNEGENKKIYPAVYKEDHYILNETVIIEPNAGLGLETYDNVSGSSNKCGVKSILLMLDSMVIYEFDIRRFSYAETRYINSHMDYEEKSLRNTEIHKLFLEPGNLLNNYNTIVDNGLLDPGDTILHKAYCTVTDFRDNQTTLAFLIKMTGNTNRSTTPVKYQLIFDEDYRFENKLLKVFIPANALYKNIKKLKIDTIARLPKCISSIYTIHSSSVPLHKKMKIAIHPDSIDFHILDKVIIARVNEKNKIISCGGNPENGYITEDVDRFGNYCLMADTIPPKIKPLNIYKDAWFVNDKTIKIQVTDNLSGIDVYDGFIDGKWVLFEYEPKQNLIFYNFDNRIEQTGKQHRLNIEVKDERKNIASYKTTFYY